MVRTSPHLKNRLAGLLLAVAVAFLPFHVLSSMDIFLQIDGVPGESRKAGFVNAIELGSFSHQVGITPGSTKPVHGNVAVVKFLDKSTLPLLLAVNTGVPFKTATITFRAPSTTGNVVFYTIRLSDVVITAVGTGANANGFDGMPLNELSFKYGTIRWDYIGKKDDGTPDFPVTTSWDVVNNQPLK